MQAKILKVMLQKKRASRKEDRNDTRHDCTEGDFDVIHSEGHKAINKLKIQM